jgi:hypothetical protein
VYLQEGTVLPEKCLTCNFCGEPFNFPGGKGQGKSGGGMAKGKPITPVNKERKGAAAVSAPPPPAAATTAPDKVTALYNSMLKHGYTEAEANEELQALGMYLPKKIVPKSLDEYERIVSINREIKQYENDIKMQSAKFQKWAESVDELLNTISEKKGKLADLKAEHQRLHLIITEANAATTATAKDAEDKPDMSLMAILIAEMDKLATVSTFISDQPNAPVQLKHLNSRVAYIKGLQEKAFDSYKEPAIVTDQDITSEDLRHVGDDAEVVGGDDDAHSDGFSFEQVLANGQPEELAANVAEGGSGSTPLTNIMEFPDISMTVWDNVQKKRTGLNLPRQIKAPKVSKVVAFEPLSTSASSASAASATLALAPVGDSG